MAKTIQRTHRCQAVQTSAYDLERFKEMITIFPCASRRVSRTQLTVGAAAQCLEATGNAAWTRRATQVGLHIDFRIYAANDSPANFDAAPELCACTCSAFVSIRGRTRSTTASHAPPNKAARARADQLQRGHGLTVLQRFLVSQAW